ncbi:MAG: bifunctional 5,10-methylenetetrahydrofolate dehydrogenase/5,10-methenyltetrahydrofolate cyclohydrolase, partial [Ignavibacteria bacterium]
MEENKIIDGKAISKQILSEIKDRLSSSKITPGLAFILVGNNPASGVYVRMKGKACDELGYYSVTDKLHENISESELLERISEYNSNEKIHGILVQLPLPKHIDEMKIIEKIDYRKDVDGFHPVNAGRMVIGEKCFIPCTPAGIIEILVRSGIQTEGKNAAVIGRSNIVGRPVAILLMRKNKNANCTVTVCHSATVNISEHTKKADIIIAAIGKANYLKSNMIKENCVIIDVGINRIEDKTSKSGYKIVGDVD